MITFKQVQNKYPHITFYNVMIRESDSYIFEVGDKIGNREYPNTILAFDIHNHPGIYDKNSEVETEGQMDNFYVKLYKDKSYKIQRAVFGHSLASDLAFIDIETLEL